MRNLLLAHFARLRKNIFFWICLIASFAYGVSSVNTWHQRSQVLFDMGQPQRLEFMAELLHNCPMFLGIMLAAFISLFLSTEYNDATIRNKLAVGHSRTNIYLSSLITMIVAAFLMCAAYQIPVLALGAPYLGVTESDPQMLAGILALCMSYCAVFAVVCMSCDRKAVASVICILGVLALIWVSINMYNQLMRPEFISSGAFDEIAQSWVETERQPNPNYVGEPLRTVYKFFVDILPTGQAMQYSNITVITSKQLVLLPLYSLVVTVLSTSAGLVLFKHKNLK